MDADSLQAAQKAAETAGSHGSWLTEVYTAIGGSIAGYFAARRVHRQVIPIDDTHPLIQVIREEGAANRAELHEQKQLLHAIARDIAVTGALLGALTKDRRP